MLKKLHGRKLAVCLIGGAMYALFFRLWLAGRARRGHLGGGALLVAALLVWPIAALLAVLLERGYTRALRREKTFRAGRAFAFILACYVPMFCVAFPVRSPTIAVPTAAGGHGRVFDTSSAAAHAGAGWAAAAWPRAGRYQPRRGAVYRAANGAAGGMLCADLRLDCAAVRARGRRSARRSFRALSAEHGDGGERDEGRCSAAFCADAGASERDPGKAVARAGAENRGLRRWR